ncbi:MAG: S9 family peptidase [Pseudomonadota bacterium]
MRVLLASLIFILTTAFSPALAEKPPLEEFAKQLTFRAATLSPDGTRLAMLMNNDDDVSLVVFTVDGKPLLRAPIEDIKPNTLQFFGNDTIVLRASETTRVRGFRGEFENSGAIAVNLSTKTSTLLLSEAENIFPAQSGLGSILGWGPEEGTVLMRAYMGLITDRKPTNDLLKVDLETGKGRRLLRGRNDTIQWISNADGDALARIDYNNKSNKFSVLKREEGSWTSIYEVESDIPPFYISGILPKGAGLVIVDSREDEDGFGQIMVLGLDGKFRGPLFKPRDREISSIYYDENKVLIGIRYVTEQFEEYDFLDKKLEASFEAMEEKFNGVVISLIDWSDDRSRVLYRIYGSYIGHYYVIHEPNTDKVQFVADLLPNIPKEELADVYSIKYQARDGLTIPAVLRVPRGIDINAKPKLPAILMPHGGPASYDNMDYDWMAQYFANRGYVVIQPNFRGSAGFGRAFQDAGRGEWGGKMQTDLDDAVSELGLMGLIDTDRVCIVGASYGGYAALVGASMTPDMYQCAISVAGVSDLNRMLQTEKREMGRNHWVVSYWEDIMAEGEARRAKLKSISPITYAKDVQIPVLLIHGDDDTVVPIRQSRDMEKALKRAKKDVSFVRLKKGDHWLSFDRHRIETLRAMDAFIAEHLPVTAE